MNYFFVFSADKIKKYFFLALALVFALGVIYLERENINVFAPQEASAIYKVNTNENVIALTFDISWGTERLEPILQTLKDENITSATFFISSVWGQAHPDLVQKIKDAGYEIGSHGHKHTNYSELENDEIRQQIQTAHSIITNIAGTEPNLIRLPNGDFDKRVLQIASDLNYKVIQWGTDANDWQDVTAEQIIARVTEQVQPGDIVLLHASDSAKQTHIALPTIIEQLRSNNYTFVSVSELLHYTETNGNTVISK